MIRQQNTAYEQRCIEILRYLLGMSSDDPSHRHCTNQIHNPSWSSRRSSWTLICLTSELSICTNCKQDMLNLAIIGALHGSQYSRRKRWSQPELISCHSAHVATRKEYLRVALCRTPGAFTNLIDEPLGSSRLSAPISKSSCAPH